MMMFRNKIKQIYMGICGKDKSSTLQYSKEKLIGIIGIILLIVGLLILFIVSIVSFFVSMNSITVTVVDQNDYAINGLTLMVSNTENSYTIEYTDNISKKIVDDVVPGDYSLVFYNIPKGYTCFTTEDNFTLKNNGKVKLEYECLKG